MGFRQFCLGPEGENSKLEVGTLLRIPLALILGHLETTAFSTEESKDFILTVYSYSSIDHKKGFGGVKASLGSQ